MSGGFSFPPPPPPPPKPTTSQQDQHEYGAQGRGRGRGRGGARGEFNQRGRANNRGRGSDSFNASPGQPSSGRGNGRGNPQQGHFPLQPHQRATASQFYGNNFAQSVPQMTPNTSNSNDNSGQQLPPAGSPPRTTAGHKRKLDALRGPQLEKSKNSAPQTAPAIPSFGAPFFASQPSLPQNTLTKERGQDIKPKTVSRGLGLVPLPNASAYSDSESEEDKDIDEEAMYAELGSKLNFEHNGVIMTLNSQGDLAAWKAERQKNWPTMARMAEKDAERWRTGEERRRLLASAEVLPRPASQRKTRVRDAKPNAQAMKPQPEISEVKTEDVSADTERKTDKDTVEREQRLAELRQKVAESEAKNRRAKATDQHQHPVAIASNASGPAIKAEEESEEDAAVEGVNVDEEDDVHIKQEDESNTLVQDEVGSSELSRSSSGGSSASESDDSAPEEMDSKPATMSTHSRPTPVCRYFTASGWCRDGESCRFRHEAVAQGSDSRARDHKQQNYQRNDEKKQRQARSENIVERKTIFQRLMDQEQDEEDRLALQVIKYLGKAGFLKTEDVDAEEIKTEDNAAEM